MRRHDPPAWERHPRLGLTLLAAWTYIFGVATLYLFADLWINAHLEADRRLAPNLAYALSVSAFITYGGTRGWRKESRSIGLHTLTDWWVVTRGLERGHAPRDQRLWWAADDLLERRTRSLARTRYTGVIVPIAATVLLLVAHGPVVAWRIGLAAVCGVIALVEPFRWHRRRKVLQAAAAELARSRPVPEPVAQPWRSAPDDGAAVTDSRHG